MAEAPYERRSCPGQMFNYHRAIGWICALALGLRLAAIPFKGPADDNLFEYGQIAWNIVQGHGFSWDFDGRFPLQPTAYSPALYCYTLVPWFAVFGLNLTGPRIMHAILLAAVCWFIYRIGERLANPRVGLMAACIWAVYPEMIFLSLRIAPENAMFLPMTWMLLKAQDAGVGARLASPAHPGKSAFTCGILTGIACWVNPSLQILGAIVPVHWRIQGWLNGREGLRRLVLFVLGAVIVIAPWTIRNYIRLGALVPLRTAFAYNVWRGNHVGATGTIRNFEGRNLDETLPRDYAEYIEAHMVPDEVQRDRFFAAEVGKFIVEHPGSYLRLCAARLWFYGWRDPTHPLTASIWYLGPWLLLLILAIMGLVSIRRDGRKWSLWLLQIAGFTLLFSLTVVVPRYRMPLYPAMFLLAAMGVNALVRGFQRNKKVGQRLLA